MRKKQLEILAAVVATMVCTALPVSAATPFGEYVFPESGLTIAQALRNADGSFPQMGAASPDDDYFTGTPSFSWGRPPEGVIHYSAADSGFAHPLPDPSKPVVGLLIE